MLSLLLQISFLLIIFCLFLLTIAEYFECHRFFYLLFNFYYLRSLLDYSNIIMWVITFMLYLFLFWLCPDLNLCWLLNWD